MSDTIAIALSGGIDSLVAAALLKDQGHHVIGLHFLNGYEAGTMPVAMDRPDPAVRAPLAAHARRFMEPLAERLGIPLHIIDMRVEFHQQVVQYFLDTYGVGKTPNPCLVCNTAIKFGVLLAKAKALGARKMASGHYARIEPTGNGRLRLMRGMDNRKEQSYFLARLTQRQLADAVMPLGDISKDQTRRIARRKGLLPVCANESQDVCFIRNGNYADFLSRFAGFNVRPGNIENVEGQVIGRHAGLHRFTIGQRRGINCPAAKPFYVVRIDSERNRLVVGDKQQLLTRRCRVHQINWIARPPDRPITVQTRVRYRHEAAPSLLTPIDGDSAEIAFHNPESAVTPGQGAVFYRNDEVLGGGWIV